jgi:hypothetical protein
VATAPLGEQVGEYLNTADRNWSGVRSVESASRGVDEATKGLLSDAFRLAKPVPRRRFWHLVAESTTAPPRPALLSHDRSVAHPACPTAGRQQRDGSSSLELLALGAELVRVLADDAACSIIEASGLRVDLEGEVDG